MERIQGKRQYRTLCCTGDKKYRRWELPLWKWWVGLPILWLNYTRNAVPGRVHVLAFFNYAISFCKQRQIPQTERYFTLLEDSSSQNQPCDGFSLVLTQHCPGPHILPPSRSCSLVTAFTSISSQPSCHGEALMKDLEWRRKAEAIWMFLSLGVASKSVSLR